MYSTVVKVYSVLTGLALAAANSWHYYVQSLQMNFSCLMLRFFERETRSRCRVIPKTLSSLFSSFFISKKIPRFRVRRVYGVVSFYKVKNVPVFYKSRKCENAFVTFYSRNLRKRP